MKTTSWYNIINYYYIVLQDMRAKHICTLVFDIILYGLKTVRTKHSTCVGEETVVLIEKNLRWSLIHIMHMSTFSVVEISMEYIQ